MDYFLHQLNMRRVLWRKADKPNEIWVCHDRGCLDNGEHTPDRRFRLGVNLKDGRAHCFNCGWKSGSKKYTFSALSKLFSIDLQNLLIPEEELEEEEGKSFSLPSEFVLFGDGSNLDEEFGREAWDYLVRKRNLTPDQIRRKRVGYAISGRYSYRVIFPVWDEECDLVGIVCRSYANQEPKYLNSTGKAQTLYNAHCLANLRKNKKKHISVVVSEGIFDALALERAGYKVAVASLGAVLTEHQVSLLDGISSVTIFAHRDEAGIYAALKSAEMLSFPGRWVWLAHSHDLGQKDPGDMSSEEIKHAMDLRVYVNDLSRLQIQADFQRERLA